jgi:hypothetical protein
MKLVRIIAVALASTTISAFALTPGPLGAIDNKAIVIGNTIPAGLLFDVYAFSLVNPGWLSGVATSLNLPPALGVSSFSVVLQNSSAVVLGTDLNPADGFSFAGLGAGSYALTFVGFATGSAGGSYGGAIYAQTVPEPGTYALLLAGLCVVGTLIRLRRPA